jgi:hypothetical protein
MTASRFIDRRTFIKGVGVAMALPWLESIARAAEPIRPGRMIILTQKFGMYAPSFHPDTEGTDYEITEGLKPLERHRNRMTVFKNLGLAVSGGHAAAPCILSDMKRTDASSHPDGGLTVDARAAELYATATRFPMLNLWGNPDNDQHTSFSRNGAKIPYVTSPVELFRLLFADLSAEEKGKRQVELLGDHSVLDTVNESARQFSKKLSSSDKQRLDEYFTTVRDSEKKLKSYKDWLGVPKPKADPVLQKEIEAARKESQVKTYDAFLTLIPLILQTDSSRVVSMDVWTNPQWDIPGITDNYHSLTHHGQLPEKIKQLMTIDRCHLSHFAGLIDAIEGMGMLDTTQLLYCSGMSDGNSHSNQNLPIILAGGGYKHGRMIDVKAKQPLSNLYNSMLQKLGVETDHFNRSTGTMGGLV